MIESGIADAAQRQLALDPAASFIVQAPAGSGKTGLLAQRYLRLLTVVEAPEEIIAITFTRKAAAEMRERILNALVGAQSAIAPDNEHEKHTWRLAKNALSRDQQCNWQLLDNPSRLRIQTIDSLCMELARQMPVLTQFGAVPGLLDNAQSLYQQAARTALMELESEHEIADALALLLQHRDNRLSDVQKLIAQMLAKRDQWLRHIVDHQTLQRQQIEAVLQQLIEEVLQTLEKLVPPCVREAFPALVRFAANNLDEPAELTACRELMVLPGTDYTQLPIWQTLSSLLLTTDGKLRKQVNKVVGFPAPGDGTTAEEKTKFKNRKQEMSALLKELINHQAFVAQLAELSKLPTPHYSDPEWLVVEALFKILLRSVAHLSVVFSERGEVDFTEMALRAQLALGDEQAPTDLALQLDYQIKHLLVDEFQDTSQNQFDLFKKLTQGWQPDDGRSLFLVGDPMQSIYRFREAEVGLFIDAWSGSLGSVPLTPLQLRVNFRSQQGIVDWVNEKFPAIMPAKNNKRTGAVCYAESVSVKPLVAGQAVSIYPYLQRDDAAEARQVIEIIQQAADRHPSGTTAILVRNKSHLLSVIELLKQHSISYQAVEIDSLSQRPVIQDLLSLTRAVFHLGDRIAWLALLRAPFIGFDLADLHAITGDDRLAQQKTVLDLLQEPARVANLSADAKARLQRVLPSITAALAHRQQGSLRQWVEGLWIQLGGAACLANATELEDVETFFQLLEALDAREEILNPETLVQQVEGLFAQADVNAGNALQLMTIHKAKGLEFDTVIVPGLGRSSGTDEAQLLYWQESVGRHHHTDLVFGPIQSAAKQTNQIADYIKSLESAKVPLENGRLLYVAATRAKSYLHLLGHATVDKQQTIKPVSNSLLKQLWPAVMADFSALQAANDLAESEQVDTTPAEITAQPRKRLMSQWQCPPPADNIHFGSHEVSTGDAVIEFDWAGETARCVGIVVHRLLQHIASAGSDVPEQEVSDYSAVAKQMLYREGVAADQIVLALNRVIDAVEKTLADQRGRWILANNHQDAHCELPITAVVNDEVQHMVIDRTFIDEHGTRWVIDYKTGHHEGGDIDTFLDREQTRYQQQLQRYAKTFQAMDDRPVRMGLYYPTMCGWREWC